MPRSIIADARLLAAACILCLAFTTHRAAAETLVLEQDLDGFSGFEDTSLYEDFVTRAGGGIDGIFSGTIRTGFLRRALIRVHLPELPEGATLTGVTLRLNVDRSGENFGDLEFGLHRITRNWGEGNAVVEGSPGGVGAPAAEGDATWNDNFFMQSQWTAPGGDFEAEPSASAVAGQSMDIVEWTGAGLLADVQAWLETPESNFGWMIVYADEGTPQRVKKFYSSEALGLRPQLLLDYTLSAPPTGCAALQYFQQPLQEYFGDLLLLAFALGGLCAMCMKNPSRTN
ncbi:MAG: DNRLRE domain-containing protein [Candidatus Hydrogenedentes bacterium]|nr:DNRLRE domain-containing protein [Candidatus Hydrogenedentota bacterium]